MRLKLQWHQCWVDMAAATWAILQWVPATIHHGSVYIANITELGEALVLYLLGITNTLTTELYSDLKPEAFSTQGRLERRLDRQQLKQELRFLNNYQT